MDQNNDVNANKEDNKWTCKRCEHESSSKCNLLKHLRRKTPCIDDNNIISIDAYIEELLKKDYNEKTYDCQFCGTKFNAYQNRHRHYKTCKELKKQNKDSIIKDLQMENARLKEQLETNKTPTQHIVNNIINNNTININLNNFGNEDISHLTHDLLSHCLFNPSKGLSKLIDNIHYNPNVPRNFNIRHKSTKNNLLEKYENEHWMECDTSNTLDELIRKGYRILNTHYTEYYMNDPEICENEIKQRALERFRFLSDKTCNEYHSVKRELRILIKDRTMYLVESPDVNNNNQNSGTTLDITTL
jgi:transcription elongation factor Elf1